MLAELDAAATADLEDYEHLHRVRILGKRLRYAMEVFAPCFAAPFKEEIYPAVEAMQDTLGLANDSHVACQRLGAMRDRLKATLPAGWKRYRPGIEALIDYHAGRLPKEREHFLEWWKGWAKSGGEAALSSLVTAPRKAPTH